MNIIKKLHQNGLINCPPWMPDNIHYLTIMGSQAYHVSNGGSDVDLYGWCIPPYDELFPHSKGWIHGFNELKHGNERWTSYSQHHIPYDGKSYDITIYNVVDYCQLSAECNPNMIDSLYTPTECVLVCTNIGSIIRDNRDVFLSKRAYHRFKGYAFSQKHKSFEVEREGKRVELVEKYGYDTKSSYHLIRLLDECDQILSIGTIDLTRDNERLKAVRNGKYSKDEILSIFSTYEKYLAEQYTKSTLSNTPRWDEVKSLLIKCINTHYSNAAIKSESTYESALKDIDGVLEKVRRSLYS